MAQETHCPDAERLALYARTDLCREDADGLDFHLAHCRSCLDHYVELGRRSVFPRVPGYHIVKEIGRGRFGVVYKAWSLNDCPKTVAVKVLSQNGTMERGRFDREIAVLRKMDSAWIVKCLSSGETSDVRYYVMELVEGIHLDSFAAAPDRTLVDKLETFGRVCRAVAHAHEHGVVHRDLKPRNILIDQNGNPRILDFGICSVDSDDGSSLYEALVGGTLTHPGDIIGTLKYMSPEQAWGGVAGAVDERSDIWSLGIMLFEIVTAGGYPYPLDATSDRPAPEALLERIRKELPRIPKLHEVPRGCDLEVLLQRCLTWERDRRIGSAALLADDLARYCHGDRIVTKPPSPLYRLKRLAVGAAARSRAMFMAFFVGFVGVTIWLSTILFDVGWMVTGNAYAESTAAPVPGFISTPTDHEQAIVIAGISDDTVTAVMDWAAHRGITGVTPDLRTWRAVYGLMMSRLADLASPSALPRAVVWDYYFRTPQPGDEALVEGLERLEQAGTPVTLAAYRFREDGSADLSPTIMQGRSTKLRVGAIVARDMTRRPGEFVLAFRRAHAPVSLETPGSTRTRPIASPGSLSDSTKPTPGADFAVPSLALVTLSALLHPQTSLEVAWRGRDRRLDLLYAISPGAYLRERDRINLTKVFKTDVSEGAVGVGDLLACRTFQLKSPEDWQQRTISFERLLSCPTDELPGWVAGKIMIVGDLRRSKPGFRADRHRVQYGSTVVEDVPGCYLMADVVSGLLDRRYVQSAFLLPPGVFVSLLLLAVVGSLAPLRLGNKRVFERKLHRRALWVILASLSTIAFAIMIASRSFVTVHLGMVGFAILVPMAGSFWVEFTRNRHRILERNRRACLSLNADSDGTITLASRPRKA